MRNRPVKYGLDLAVRVAAVADFHDPEFFRTARQLHAHRVGRARLEREAFLVLRAAMAAGLGAAGAVHRAVVNGADGGVRVPVLPLCGEASVV
jgi:hypothetical protein